MDDDRISRAIEAYWQAHPGAVPADYPPFVQNDHDLGRTAVGEVGQAPFADFSGGPEGMPEFVGMWLRNNPE